MIRCPGKPERACGATTLEAQRVSGERVLVSCLACGRFRWVGRDRWAAHAEDVTVVRVARVYRDGRAAASGETPQEAR